MQAILGWQLAYIRETEVPLMSSCIYCGSEQYGGMCFQNNNGPHVHNDPEHCIYCGSEQYGGMCYYNDNGPHVHGSGGHRCVYCGSEQFGGVCYYNNNGPHIH